MDEERSGEILYNKTDLQKTEVPEYGAVQIADVCLHTTHTQNVSQ